MHRHIAAPMSRVFAAWTNPEVIRTWFAPGDMHVEEATAEARPGGRYRIVMQQPDGQQHIVGGEFLALHPDDLVEFSWRWENPDANTTRVRIDLREADGGTDLTLTHSEFVKQEYADSHEKGWIGCLAKLEPALAA